MTIYSSSLLILAEASVEFRFDFFPLLSLGGRYTGKARFFLGEPRKFSILFSFLSIRANMKRLKTAHFFPPFGCALE